MRDGAQDYIQKDEIARLPSAVDRTLRDAAARLENKLMQAVLRESEARFRSLVNSIEDAIFTWIGMVDTRVCLAVGWKNLA